DALPGTRLIDRGQRVVTTIPGEPQDDRARQGRAHEAPQLVGARGVSPLAEGRHESPHHHDQAGPGRAKRHQRRVVVLSRGGRPPAPPRSLSMTRSRNAVPPHPWVWLTEISVVTALYYVTGRLGLAWAIPPGIATPVWPPSGIALAAVLLRGRRVWPGIW